MTHGQKLSILFARASSIAQALPGVAKINDEGCEGLPGCDDAPALSSVGRSEGDRMGDENERRYSAMKKSSLRAQTRNKTVCKLCQRYRSVDIRYCKTYPIVVV